MNDPRLKPVKVYGKSGAIAAPAPTRASNPVLAGILVAIPAAAGWAVIAYTTHYEIGWVAWGLGALIGFVVGKTAREPGPHGMTAAAIAVGALILAKVLILEFALPSIIEQEVLKNREATAAMFLVDMGEHRTFSDQLLAEAEQSRGSGDARAGALASQMAREARERANSASPDERQRVVHRHVSALLQEAGFFSMLGRLFSLFDVLWIFLAVGSAFRIANKASAFET